MTLPAVLQPMARHAGEAALFLDFDGTLAPIVADPADAAALPGAPEVLGRLCQRFGLVAVVSGRPIEFLLAQLGTVPRLHLAGLYGLQERLADGRTEVDRQVAPWLPVVAAVTRRALMEAPQGIGVEPKGLTVTLHWRTRPDLSTWAQDFAQREAAATGLVVQPGRMAAELRPPVATDKGTVVDRLGPGHRAAACFGDDLGDLPAFAAVKRLSAQGMAVACVGVVDEETPVEVREAADLEVEGPQTALDLLDRLATEPATER